VSRTAATSRHTDTTWRIQVTLTPVTTTLPRTRTPRHGKPVSGRGSLPE
jgi:hypothetical protein